MSRHARSCAGLLMIGIGTLDLPAAFPSALPARFLPGSFVIIRWLWIHAGEPINSCRLASAGILCI